MAYFLDFIVDESFDLAEIPFSDAHLIKNTLDDGQLIVIPTDTVYGIAALASSQAAILRLNQVKRRLDKPPPVLFHSIAQALSIIDFRTLMSFHPKLPPLVRKLTTSFWPGELTLIVPPVRQNVIRHYLKFQNQDNSNLEVKQNTAQKTAINYSNILYDNGMLTKQPMISSLLLKDETLAIRVPNSNLCRSILRLTGPLAASSANITGNSPAYNIRQAWNYFDEQVALYIRETSKPKSISKKFFAEIGKEPQLSSTILDCCMFPPRFLRIGRITEDNINSVVNKHIGE